jgi:hypothetical protein
MLGYAIVIPAYARALASESGEDDRLSNKVVLVLSARFNNSIFGTIRMISFCMWPEAFMLYRAAFEVLQYQRLLGIEPAYGKTFFDSPLSPVEVRRTLEKVGHDVEAIRNQYRALSGWAHVGGASWADFDVDDGDSPVVAFGGTD